MNQFNRHFHSTPRFDGFTFLEVLMTLVVVSILTTLAIPSLQQMITWNQITGVTNELSAALNLARSEAVSRGMRITVCKSNQVHIANPQCTPASNWQDGWLVFVDDSTGACVQGTVDCTDQLLRIYQPDASANNIAIDAGVSFGNCISYNAAGTSDGCNGVSTGHFFITSANDCQTEQDCWRCVIINNTGRIRIKRWDPTNPPSDLTQPCND